ncbi:MAG: hypothetical protein LBU48_05635 [Coriobacteriales bacterium]|nr:hypothetical protein [Coriobacteriales bacterium]
MTDEALISSKVLAGIRSLTELKVEFDHLPTKGLPMLSMQTLTGTPVERRFKSGGYIGNYRFALYLRQQAEDNASRLDAEQVLKTLAGQVEKLPLALGASIALLGITQDTLPAKVSSDEAYDDQQVTFTLKYKKGRNHA